MEKFLGNEETPKITTLDNSKLIILYLIMFLKYLSFFLGATIEALLESLSKHPHSRFQIWDELGTLINSFGLYKAGI